MFLGTFCSTAKCDPVTTRKYSPNCIVLWAKGTETKHGPKETTLPALLIHCFSVLRTQCSSRVFCKVSIACGTPSDIVASSAAPSEHAADTAARSTPVAHQRLVVDGTLHRVIPLPTRLAVITEAGEITTEVRARLQVARGALGIFQVGINLDLKGRQVIRTD